MQYENVLKIALKNKKLVCTKYYADYLNLLYKLDKRVELLENAKIMHSLFESDWISLRWICKIFNETYVETNNMIEEQENIRNFSEALSKLESPSATALFSKSILLVEQKRIIEAKEVLEQVVNILPGLLHAWILVLKCCIQMLLFDEAINATNRIDKLLQNNDSRKKLKKTVDILMIEVLSRSNEEMDLKRALELFNHVCFYFLCNRNLKVSFRSMMKQNFLVCNI